jgi:hypothetical protein
MGARVLATGQQVCSQRDLGLRPGRHVRPAGPLSLVVIGHPAFLAAVHLDVGGVNIDGHRALGQLRRPLGRQQAHHPRRGLRQARLRASPVPSVNRRAIPVAVEAARPGTGTSRCPARSARARSRPTRKSSPASCAAAIPASTCPPANPRRRC